MNVSVLITDQEFLNHFGIAGNKVMQGQLMSVFLIAYGISSFFISPLYETFLGVRKGYLVSIFIWALFTLISPFAGGMVLLLVFRFILGASEGPLFSLKTMYINEWFRDGERGKPNALASVGASLGLAIGVPLTTYLVYSFNWHVSFYVIGLLNLVVGVPLIWFCLSKNRGPVFLEQQTSKVEPESETAKKAVPPLQRLANTFRLAITTPGLGWMILVQICHQSYLWGTSSWLPSYLLQEKGFSIKAMGAIASMPFVVSLCAGLYGGYIVDRIPKNKMAAMFVFGGIATAVTVTCAIKAQAPMTTALLLILANAFWGMQSPAIPTIIQLAADKRSVGSAYGIMNGMGNLVSSFMPAAMGALIGLYGGFSAGFSLVIGAEAMVVICGIRLLMHKKIKATQLER
jgi:MFS family permease